MKKATIIFLITVLFSYLGFSQSIKLDFSNLKVGQINIYKTKIRGVATAKSSFSSEKTEFNNEIYMSQLIREVDSKGNVIIQTNIDSEKNTVNGNPVAPESLGDMYFIQMDKLGNIISSATNNKKKINSDFQLSFPDKTFSIGDIWKKKIVIRQLGKEYPVECKYKIAGFEKISGVKCVKIETVSKYLNEAENSNKMTAKGVIYFDPKESLILKSVVSTFISSSSSVLIGGINTENEYSIFLTVSQEYLK